ncbi:M20 family metallopeptidase [Mesosutterella sp. AGMB02718]|uniref:M20 family metallopeptidase n=1 Tax=Mesosutterella faecium TaxID=2925194 RepID=A0ABT7IMB7_9BURK|nr:M20 family metallopeptidase [Mesosutterella sp. AGMB02718]MDL2059518.1 M20 family metallopeptidase [Mesosutterella sp. AGMB02718]
MTLLEDYLKDLEQLVSCEAGTSNPEGVTQAAQYMKKLYDSIGFSTELVDLGPEVGRGLLATNKPGAQTYDIMLNGHLDTVFPKGEAARRPFRRDAEKAYGPGVLDCKAGILSIFYGIKSARPEDIKRLSIAVAMNPDEETGSTHSTDWLVSIGRRAKRVLICEPARPNGELVRSRKGSATYRVEFHGRTAHAGNNPQDGANAAVAMMRFATALYDELNNFETGTTVNPGVVEGGKIINAIPDHAMVRIDTRYCSDAEGRRVGERIAQLAAQTWVKGVTATTKREFWIPAMPLSDSAKELNQLLTKAAAMAGFEAHFVDAGGAADGNHIAEFGVPVCDGCGPAGDNMHTDREFLTLRSVEPAVKMQSNLYSLI